MKRTSLLLSLIVGVCLPLGAQDNPPAVKTDPPKPSKAERNIRFQFDGIPYADVLERFAQMANKPLVADAKPEGNLTFHDSKPYTFGEAVDTLNVILATKGYVLTEDEHYLRLAPLSELSRMPLKILQGSQDAKGVRPEEVVTVVLTMKNLQAQDVGGSITNMLTKAGSVAPLSQGRGLIITDRLQNIQRIESLINTVDTEAVVERQMKSFTLLHSSGAVLQDLLTRTFGKSSAPKKMHYDPRTKRTTMLDPEPSQYITAVFDEASRTMILFGPQDRMALAEELINEFEDKEGGAGEVRIYRPVAKKPTELAEMLRQAVPGIAASGESAATAATKARLIIDESENRLIVAAPLAQQADQIEEIINSLDRPVHGKNGTKNKRAEREVVQLTRVFEIREMEISKVGDLLKQVLTRELSHGGFGVTAKITVEPNSKTVVLTGSPEDIRKAEDIIEQLDGKRRMALPRNLKIFSLQHARAAAILENANTLITERMNDPRFEREIAPSVIADEKNNRLLITATDAQLEVVEEVVATLDIAPAKQKRAMSMLPVRSKTPEEMIALVSELVGQLGEDVADPGMAPKLFPDSASRQIIVLATADDTEKIATLVRELEASGARSMARETRGIELFGRKAEDLAPLVQQLYQEQISGAQEPEGGAATLLAEARDNRILVTGTEAEIERVEAIVRQLDPEGSKPKTEETRVFTLQSALATDLSTVVEQAVVARSPNARILTDSRSNSLIVTGESDAIDAADKLIQQLDKRPRMEPREMRVIELQSADAASLAEMVTTVGAEMLADQRGADYTSQTRVVPDNVGGRLIISGPRDELALYESVVERLDNKTGDKGSARVFQLQNSDAEQIAQILSKALVTTDVYGRSSLRVGISTDLNSNSIVITGERQDLLDAENIIQKLDGGEAVPGGATGGGRSLNQRQRGLKVFEVADGVAAGDASNLATLARNVFESQNANRPGVDQVSFTIGPEGKKLIVMAPVGLLDQVETVVNLLNTKSAKTKRRLQRLETAGQGGADVVSTVQKIYTEQSLKQTGPAASIYADPSGSGLMVYGSEAQIEQVRQIVSTLSTAPSPKRETKVFEVGNSADVQRLQPLVEQLYTDQWKGKAGADAADAQILADTRMGRLIVTGKPDHVKEIGAIIEQLGVSGRKSESGKRQTKVFQLNGGDADALQELVETLYEDQAKDRFGNENPDTLILADDDNNRLVVSGDEAEVRAVAEIVSTLQVDVTEGGSAKIFVIKHANPETVARIVSMAVSGQDTSSPYMRYYRFSRYRAPNAPKQFNASADASTRTVIVSGEPKDVLAAASIIEQLDKPADTSPRKMRVVEVGPGEADEVADQVRELFQDQAKSRPELRENDILVMDGANGDRIIVSGNDAQLEVVDEIIKTISPEATRTVEKETRVYDILNGDADDIGDVVRDLYRAQLKKRKTRPESQALILDDRSTNRLLVSAIPEEMKAIDAIITQLDKARPRDDSVKFIKLKNADPDNMRSILSSAIVRYNSRGYPVPLVTSTVDRLTGTLILTGRQEDLKRAEQLIADYDGADIPREERVTRFVKTHDADPDEIARQLDNLYEADMRQRGKRNQADAVFMGNDDANRVIITARESDMEFIDDALAKLLEGWGDAERRVQMFTLKHVPATPVADMVMQLFDRRYSRSRNAARVTTTPGPDGKTLLVDSDGETLERVADLIETLDKPQGDGDAIIQTVHLEEGESEAIARALMETINAEGANPELKTVHVTPVAGTKTILLNGPRESVDKVMEIVKMLDTGSIGGEAEVRIYQLNNTTARDIEPILAQLIKNLMSKGASGSGDSRNSRNRRYPFYGYYPYSGMSANQDSSGKQPSITLHEETNRLLITAKPEQFELIEKLLPELDKAPESSDKDVQFVWLKTADGYEIIDAIDAFYADRSRRDQPYLETDLMGEQLTIIAKRSDMPQILDLIEQFDQGVVEIDQQIRMVSLSRVPVEQMAEMLKTLYPQMYSGKLTFVERLEAGNAPEELKEQERKSDEPAKGEGESEKKTEEAAAGPASETPEVVISIDKKTNMLILSGPSDELAKVDEIIFELEFFALPGDTDLHVYPLKKADPAVVAKTLNDLFRFEAQALAAQQAKPKTGANNGQPNNNQRNQQRAARPPKMIVVPEPRTRSIIVRATPTDYLTVESLIEKLDQAGEQSKIAYRLIPLKNAPAAKLAPMITLMAEQMKAAQPGDALVIEPYDRNRSLLVIGRAVVIDEIETMIKDLDIPASDEEVEVAKVELEFADAATVARTLGEIFSKGASLKSEKQGDPEQGEGKALTRPFNVAVDSRLNTLFLSGAKQAVILAQKIVTDMDRKQEGFLTEVKLIQLRYASAAKVLPLLQAVFAERNAVPGAEGVSTFVTRLKTADKEGKELTSDQPKSRAAMVLQADEALNILVVAARSDALPLIEAVVKQLDIPEASGIASVRIYPLEHADATSVRSIIIDVYAGSLAGSNRTADRPNVMVDQRSNSLVVAGTDASFAMIDSLLAMLDTELPLELRDIHILPLEHADANELAATIQNLMDSRISRIGGGKRGEAEAHRVLIVPEARSNSLLIAGGKDSFELVESLAKRLDSAAPALSGTIRLLPLNFADARTVASSFDSLFTARYAATRGTERNRNKPVIVADARINALLITAAMDDNGIIDELLPKLDRKLDNPSLLLTVVPLKHNDAAQVANMLEDIFDARLKSRAVPGQTPSPSEEVAIEVDSLNNTLIVSSNKENLETISDLLKQVDVQPMMAEGVFETFVLEHADAQRVATLIQSLIQQGLYRPGRAVSRSSRSRSSRSAGEALAVAVDPRSNTLIVSASPENLGVVKEVIRQVDTADFAQGGDLKFYKLENAQASDIAVTLNAFFESKRTADSVAINAPERSIPVSIIPDDRINSLLVTGSKEAFDTLDRILPELDGEDQISRQNFKVIPLRNATATALRETLEQLFANRPAPVKGQRPDPITLVADAWVNALIVGARVHDMTMVESMIEKLDSEQAELGVKVEVIPVLKANVERIAETVQELYRESSSRASGLPVFVNADERLNALVVSGGETDLKRIKEVVRKLDTDEVSRVNEIRVIPLEYARADSLATILSSALNDKPDSLEGGNDDSQSLLQFVTSTDEGETFVTSALHEAVLITPDTRMNSLIVSGPVDYMGLLERIVKRLDDASPREAQIKVFALKNTEARIVGQLLLGLFRLTPTGAPAAGNDRSIEYTLFQPTANGEQAVASAVVGAEEQSALRISIDTRSNSVLVGGSEHYIGLVSEVIESLDTGGGVQRKSQVYRLKNAQAADVSTAIRDFLDQDRQRITQVLGQDAVRTAEALLEKEVAIVAEPVSNTLLLSAHAHYFETLNTMIEELDRAQPQVLVQVLLAEITVDAMRDLGVEWNYTKTLGNGWDFGTGTDFGVPAELASLGGYSALVTGNNFNFLLRALENDGHLEVLSRPQILTADNQPASINIGQRVPLITGSQITPQGGVNNQFDYRDVGVSLAVTPRIVGDGFVQIDVQTTNSSISSSTVQINADATVPIINERRASTMVSVQSGQTVVIGGLISASEDSRERKMPVLGSIPLLGNLFKSSRNVSDRKELLVLLTPQILNSDTSDPWSRDINEFSEDMIRESSMKNVFKDDEKKRAMFERVFPTDVEPEDGDVKPQERK